MADVIAPEPVVTFDDLAPDELFSFLSKPDQLFAVHPWKPGYMRPGNYQRNYPTTACELVIRRPNGLPRPPRTGAYPEMRSTRYGKTPLPFPQP